MTQCQVGAPIWNRKIFFDLQVYITKRRCENLQSARGLARCKSGPAITWLVDVTIYCTIFQKQFSISPPTSPVCRHKILFKKISRGKSWLNESLNFNWGAWASWRKCTPIASYFHDKTKISKENLRVDYYLLLKCSQSRVVNGPNSSGPNPKL